MQPGSGGTLSVCLIYPHNYSTAMSSLGFQTVYRLFNQQPGVICERAFLPDRSELSIYRKTGEPLVSLENERPLSEFDLLAFSISFEPDFIAVPQILELGRVRPLSAERSEDEPLVVAGGSAFLINPEPVADFFDLIFLGEGEQLIPPLTTSLLQHRHDGKGVRLRLLATLPGSYSTAAGEDAEVICQIAPERSEVACSQILTEETGFGKMYLIETDRGCPRGCRFCAAGFVHQPFRQIPLERLKGVILTGLSHRKTIGLVGAAVSDHPQLYDICKFILDHGGAPSLASLRVDRITEQLISLLAQAGHRTISLAPEGGSQRMRDMIRKNLTREQILTAAERVGKGGILNLRLYFIIGLPGEGEQDLAELLELVADIRTTLLEQSRQHGRLGEITLSVNPFIPKPSTPLQWAGLCSIKELERKIGWLGKQVRTLPNVRLKVENLQGALLQGLLSKGGRGVSRLILEMAKGANLKRAARTCDIDLEAEVTRFIPPGEPLPWQRVQTGGRVDLEGEYRKAMELVGVTV